MWVNNVHKQTKLLRGDVVPLDTTKWVYIVMSHVDGNVTIYKARLVAQGYFQVMNIYIDYDKTIVLVSVLKQFVMY